MERKKKTSWTFRCTVITILIVLAIVLFRDGEFYHGVLGNPVPDKETDPSYLLKKTTERIEGLKSISAKIDISVLVGKSRMTGGGKYEELALKAVPEDREIRQCFGGYSLFRLHLSLRSNDAPTIEKEEENTLDAVCDKETLWTSTSIEGEKKLTELKLREMAAVLAQSARDEREQKILAANGISIPVHLSGFPGLGGMSGLLRRLSTAYDFDSNIQSVWLKGKKNKIRAWKLTGSLKEELQKKAEENLLGDNPGGRKPILKRLPAGIEIYIGQYDLFPYRLCYFSIDEADPQKRSELMTLNFTDVYEDHFSVVPENFVYSPGGLSESINKKYLKQLIPGIEY